MLQPVSSIDILNFLQVLLPAFQDQIFFGFTLLVAFTIAIYIKDLVIGNHL